MDSKLSKAIEPKETSACVDTHFHVFRRGQAQEGARYVPDYEASLSVWQSNARSVGVTRGVLVQTSFMGTDNGLLIDTLTKSQGTLRGVAVVSPQARRADLDALHEAGVRGIRLNLAGQSPDMHAWAPAKPLWDDLLELGWHLEIHTDAGCLPKVIDTLPQALPLVVDHFAKPGKASSQDATVRALSRRRLASVHIKLSAAYRLEEDLRTPGKTAELARLWLTELGPQALLWGSDWPCTNHESMADYAGLFSGLTSWLGEDETLLKAVRSVNPLRLYWC